MAGYDYIILGAGAAGLSLSLRILDSPLLRHKRILLLDRSAKKQNDRTWCFWENNPGFFEPIVYRRWKQLQFAGATGLLNLDIGPYRYKMIRGIDFYQYAFNRFQDHPNLEFRQGELALQGNQVFFNGERLETGSAICFSSIPQAGHPAKKPVSLLQHFKGWVITSSTDCFEPGRALLMDFRVSQQQGTSFVYVLPLSKDTALVEYTQFTAELLPPEQYDLALQQYIEAQLQVKEYRICETEFGVIPMTNARFPLRQAGCYQIGTAGGQTRASTGYTFQFIQKQCRELVAALEQNRSLDQIPALPGRFRFYDSVLLQLLADGSLGGRQIFERLFQRNSAAAVFRFLDGESKVPEELRLISSLQTLPFARAALRQLL